MVGGWQQHAPGADRPASAGAVLDALAARRAKVPADPEELRRRGPVLPALVPASRCASRSSGTACAGGSPSSSRPGMAPATIRARQLPVRRFTAWLADEGEIERRPVRRPEVAQARRQGRRAPDRRPAARPPRRLPASEGGHPSRGAAAPARRGHRPADARDRGPCRGGRRDDRARTSTCRAAPRSSGAARAARGGSSRSARTPCGPSTATCGCAATTASAAPRRTCGSATAASGSPTTPCTRPSGSGPAPRASRGFHPHRMRHTAAHRWLAAGGTETGLMAVAGWTRPDMLLRYTQAQASARAAAEARPLNLGDL